MSDHEKTIKYLVQEAYTNSKEKGFHDDDDAVTPAHRLMLIAGEVNEAFEEIRDGRDLVETHFTHTATLNGVKFKGLSPQQYEAITGKSYEDDKNRKPEGVPSELADTVIRIFDFCGTYGIDLEAAVLQKMAFNSGREHKHGRSF